MASAITGINRSITGILESAGPKTFFVQRYFSGGLDISDGSDELSPWRRMPWITVEEAELIRQLPAVRDVNIGEYTDGPVSFEGVELKSVAHRGDEPELDPGQRRRHPGRAATSPRGVRGRRAGRDHQRQAGRVALSRARSDRQDDQDLRPAVPGHRRCTPRPPRSSATPTSPRLAIPHTTFTKVADYERGLDGDRGACPPRRPTRAGGAGPGDRRAPHQARPQAGAAEQLRHRDPGPGARHLQQDHRRLLRRR